MDGPTSTTTIDRLIDYLLDGDRGDAVAVELAAWAGETPRFRSFLDGHRDKIRKKLRGTDDDARLHVRAELAVARALLTDRRFDVAFEAYGSGKLGPDFTVMYRANRGFDLEVTRLRSVPEAPWDGRQLLAKLRQLRPGTPNVLVLAIPAPDPELLDVAGTVQALRRRADRKDEAFFVDRGLEGSRGFYERFLRLGAVVTLAEGGGAGSAAAWRNTSARIAVPAPALGALVRCLTVS